MHQTIDNRTEAEVKADRAALLKSELDAHCLSLKRLMAQTWGLTAERRKDIAYRVADLCHAIHQRGGNPQSLVETELTDFVWNNTHYDECSNWFFFRRS